MNDDAAKVWDILSTPPISAIMKEQLDGIDVVTLIKLLESKMISATTAREVLLGKDYVRK